MSRYSRMHYRDQAAEIRMYPDHVIRRAAAIRWADKYSADNPRFDRVKFMKACGI